MIRLVHVADLSLCTHVQNIYLKQYDLFFRKHNKHIHKLEVFAVAIHGIKIVHTVTVSRKKLSSNEIVTQYNMALQTEDIFCV